MFNAIVITILGLLGALVVGLGIYAIILDRWPRISNGDE